MSTNQATEKAKDAWESFKELLAKTDAEVRKEINQAAPVVQRSVGASIETATRTFDSTMKSISKHTEREQLELLKAYKRFLSSQSDFVDSRMKNLDEQARDKGQG
jgi:hypothetical protein